MLIIYILFVLQNTLTMSSINVKIPSPTLEVEALQALAASTNKAIATICKIVRAKKVRLRLSAVCDDDTENPLVITLSELPTEIWNGLHTYATRLIADQHTINAEIRKITESQTTATNEQNSRGNYSSTPANH